MNTNSLSNSLTVAAKLIAEADGIIIAAGAGMGVDSGLPDFRGNAGFWKAYPALAADGTGFMDIASPAAFHNDPGRAWGFYGHRLALYRKTTPHAGFTLLRRWGDAAHKGYFVFTSNVDGQFQHAGFSAERVHECHGSIHTLQCLQPCCQAVWSANDVDPIVDGASCRLQSPLPACPYCGGLARPNILLFNDTDWIDEAYVQQAQTFQRWLEQLRKPVVIELGAGTALPAVRRFSQRIVLEQQAALVRINPQQPDVGKVQGVGIAGGALEIVTVIDGQLHTPGT